MCPIQGPILWQKFRGQIGLSCVQILSKTEKTVSSKVKQTKQVNEYESNDYYSLSVGPFKGLYRPYETPLRGDPSGGTMFLNLEYAIKVNSR